MGAQVQKDKNDEGIILEKRKKAVPSKGATGSEVSDWIVLRMDRQHKGSTCWALGCVALIGASTAQHARSNLQASLSIDGPHGIDPTAPHPPSTSVKALVDRRLDDEDPKGLTFPWPHAEVARCR